MQKKPLVITSGLGGLLATASAPVLAAGGALPSLVNDIGFCVVLAGILAVVFARLGIPVIAAFLIAGVVVGPIGTGLVTDPANIETISQLGLVLLLFLIGLEIDIRKMFASGRTLALSGLLQYPLCVAFGFGITKALLWIGVGSDLLGGGTTHAPLYIGLTIAASSTLLVVQLFQESFQLDTEAGRLSLGLLIFQDIWAISVIAIMPNLNDPQLGPILFSFLGIGLLGTISALAARHVIPIGFRWITKMPEVILVAAVSWCFIIVLLGTNLDVLTQIFLGIETHIAVGPGMGALIAGASIASLPYSTEIISKVGVVRDFFVTLFFVGLGMSIPMPETFDVLVLAGLLAVIALLARYLIFFPLLYFAGQDRRTALTSSTRLAQVSEFSLVIGFLGMQLGHISPGLNSSIIFAFVITALLTPALFRKADAIHDRLVPILERIGFRSSDSETASEDVVFSLALLGFHKTASSLLHQIAKNHPHLLAETLVVDFNVNIHYKIASRGPTVRYGDLGNPVTLQHSGVDKARVIACTVPDDVLKGTSNRQLVKTARKLNPDAVIIANAIDLEESRRIYEAGADYVFLQRIETARAVERAIEKALAGEIGKHRSAVEMLDGKWHTREEVL